MMTLLTSVLEFLAPVALAQGPCAGVDCGAGGNPLPAFVALGAAVLLEVASGLAVASVVVSGAFMLLNLGDESRFSRGKKGVIYGCVAFALTLSSQAIISFAVARAVQVDGSQPVLSIMAIGVRSMLIVMNVSFALMMLFYGFKLLLARGQQSELDATKKGIGWTIAGAAAVNLSYALIRATALLGF